MKFVERQRNLERVMGVLQARSPLSRAEISEATDILNTTIKYLANTALKFPKVCGRWYGLVNVGNF